VKLRQRVKPAQRVNLGTRQELISEILFQQGMSLLASSSRTGPPKPSALWREFRAAVWRRWVPGLAEADLRAGADAEALAGFRKVVKDYPRRPAGRRRSTGGVASARQGLAEEALQHFLRYIELDPGGGLAASAEQEIRRSWRDRGPTDRVLRTSCAGWRRPRCRPN